MKTKIFIIFAITSFGLFADIPAKFDLRDVDSLCYVSSVKNQSGGTCWAHGSMAAIESNLMMTGEWQNSGEEGEPNLAEYHLDWWNGFNQHNNDDLNPPTGDGLVVHEGGDYRVTAAYLSRGEGAVRDIDGQQFDNAPLRNSDSYHHFYAKDIEWFVAGPYRVNFPKIKQRIMTEGALGTCMCYNGEFIEDFFVDGKFYKAHYQTPKSELDPNHSIAIIGWDDSLETGHYEDGAWLCKNSWGEDWGSDGYFWISYADKHCIRHPEMGAVSFRNVVPLPYDKIYYHDYHGWRATKTDCQDAFNAFIAEKDQYLQAVSFYTTADTIDYSVDIYDDFIDGTLMNKLSQVSGSIEHTGFHTVDLNEIVQLTKNDDFYIKVHLSKGGHAFDRTSIVPVLLISKSKTITVNSSAKAGESFYFDGSAWIDFYTYSLDPWPDGTGNFCIKGLAVDSIPASEVLNNSEIVPAGFTLNQNYPNPFNNSTVIKYRINNPQQVKLTLYNIAGQEVKTLINKYQLSGVYRINFNASQLRSGVYFYRIQAGKFSATKKMVLLK